MSIGSVSDPEDVQELSITGMDERSLENSDDEFSVDDNLKGKTKRPRVGANDNNKQQMKMAKDGRQSQRNAANARERARMRVLSKAFSRLKTSLPWVPADTKLSKLDTLRLASSYISHLRLLLQEDRYENDFVHPVNLTWPFGVSARLEDTKDIPTAIRLCGATA
ncbi:transcription factor 21-like isoform X1 [Myxocyprinus asiaticus]|uniref:transcription factor 21-like isoform X1 n=1 Tax=Myxocyprinus asiaticus TaxID=70543 RepID=UPI002222B02B|nr:transcription factor 21-like isoform X1 [Myxocyprinus asiaticus]